MPLLRVVSMAFPLTRHLLWVVSLVFTNLDRLILNRSKPHARLEVSRMERGMFLLSVVIGAAPLVGLLGHSNWAYASIQRLLC